MPSISTRKLNPRYGSTRLPVAIWLSFFSYGGGAPAPPPVTFSYARGAPPRSPRSRARESRRRFAFGSPRCVLRFSARRRLAMNDSDDDELGRRARRQADLGGDAAGLALA